MRQQVVVALFERVEFQFVVNGFAALLRQLILKIADTYFTALQCVVELFHFITSAFDLSRHFLDVFRLAVVGSLRRRQLSDFLFDVGLGGIQLFLDTFVFRWFVIGDPQGSTGLIADRFEDCRIGIVGAVGDGALTSVAQKCAAFDDGNDACSVAPRQGGVSFQPATGDGH